VYGEIKFIYRPIYRGMSFIASQSGQPDKDTLSIKNTAVGLNFLQELLQILTDFDNV